MKRRGENREPKTKRQRTIPLSDEVAELVKGQLEAFRRKFDREPGPEDPLFFDPDADTPRPLDPEVVAAEMLRAMEAAGIDPAKIYAWQQTGVLLTEDNAPLVSSQDKAAWQAAVERYRSLQDKHRN